MNITLIGMAGAGKSFIGEQLAAALHFDFVDTDTRMEERYALPLQSVLEALGDEQFIAAESVEVLSLGNIQETVIAPGGSVIYSPEAVTFLKSHSMVVYLAVPLELIEKRIDIHTRGIVGLATKTFAELYAERQAAYETIADVRIATEGMSVEEIIEQIMSTIEPAKH
jgi:shikimate kinase